MVWCQSSVMLYQGPPYYTSSTRTQGPCGTSRGRSHTLRCGRLRPAWMGPTRSSLPLGIVSMGRLLFGGEATGLARPRRGRHHRPRPPPPYRGARQCRHWHRKADRNRRRNTKITTYTRHTTWATRLMKEGGSGAVRLIRFRSMPVGPSRSVYGTLESVEGEVWRSSVGVPNPRSYAANSLLYLDDLGTLVGHGLGVCLSDNPSR